MEVSNIYYETLESLRFGTRRVVHQGGSNSGKTVNILAALATLCNEEQGGVTTVTSMSFPHLKGGALRDFETFVYPEFKGAIKQYHKTNHIFTFKSGSILEFKVFQDEMVARGPKRKRLFINEANKFLYLVYFQLDSRSDQTILDYNPSLRFWAHDKVIGQDGTLTLISDHRDNHFLSAAKHREIESIKDPELWKVYARGLTGNVTGLIFPDWEMIDADQYPRNEEQVYSIDFGYTNDPTALIRHCKVADTLFIQELCYEPGLSAISIVNLLRADGYNADTMPLYCEHDPDMIKQLRKLGVQAFPARKGQGSVNAGIELLKQYRVKYTNTSRNLHKERSLYIWEVDKEGNTTNIPVDNNNHCFDAIRYGAYTRYLRN